ncbi:MAG TPA: hypothetical protein VF678_05085 [bacterium]
MKEHVGWFQPGSVSLSFTFAVIIGAIIITGVYIMIRYLMRRNLAAEGGHKH